MFKHNTFSRRVANLDVHSPLYVRSSHSDYCGGDIGDLYELIDKAHRAGFSYLQFTPIQDTGSNPSPYMGLSIFSYNPIFLSFKKLKYRVDFDLIDKKVLAAACSDKIDHVSYRNLYSLKVQALRQIFEKHIPHDKFKKSKCSGQVLAYSLFKALKAKYRGRWVNWPNQYKSGMVDEILKRNPSLWREVEFNLFVQETLENQWLELKNYAEKKNIGLILDKPIYPVHDSAEVWANQKLFYLRKDGLLRYGSGCDNPRDPFGAQYWGHAVYKYKEHPKEVIDFFIKQVKFISQIAQIVRLDHTLALIWKYYIIDPKTKKGLHRPALKHRLFREMIKALPSVGFIAEDLGYISTRNVDLPLSKYKIPGMRCMQWYHIPKYSNIKNYPESCVAMTSNHDLDSLPSFWHHLRSDRKKIFIKQLVQNPSENFRGQIWQLIELIFQSNARFASVTLRDLSFDLRRYNKPGLKFSGNWNNRSNVRLDSIDFKTIENIIIQSKRK